MQVDKSNYDVYLFNSDRPFHHYASGQLVLDREETPKRFELGDAYELLVCAGGQCRVSWERQGQLLRRGTCLLVAPHTKLELVTIRDIDISGICGILYPKCTPKSNV
ncbi:hypothetical protein, partial [Limosilactobacillus antri]|uniref:hypothetical protein n=1 Tax=Limosilactobacillus antri TaxID=227943 RepID=UPI001F5970A4